MASSVRGTTSSSTFLSYRPQHIPTYFLPSPPPALSARSLQPDRIVFTVDTFLSIVRDSTFLTSALLFSLEFLSIDRRVIVRWARYWFAVFVLASWKSDLERNCSCTMLRFLSKFPGERLFHSCNKYPDWIVFILVFMITFWWAYYYLVSVVVQCIVKFVSWTWKETVRTMLYHV